MTDRNPYNWTAHNPTHIVPRTELVAKLLRDLAAGKPAHLIGARGMGKTVFLAQLERSIVDAGQLPVLIQKRPAQYTVPSTTKALASRLQKDAERRGVVEERDRRNRLRCRN